MIEKEVSSYSENSKIFDISEVESESGNFEGSFTNDEIGSITNNLHNELIKIFTFNIKSLRN